MKPVLVEVDDLRALLFRLFYKSSLIFWLFEFGNKSDKELLVPLEDVFEATGQLFQGYLRAQLRIKLEFKT